MAQQLKTFEDLYTAALELLKIQSGDTTAVNRVKRALNITYLNEVVPFHPWTWLRGNRDVSLEPVYDTGTVTVSNASTTITFSSAPGTSRAGHYFAVDGYSELYRIADHTAASTTATLEAPYTGDSDSGLAFKVWTDVVALPADCREVLSVKQFFQSTPMEGCGLEKFNEYRIYSPRAEGNPQQYTLGDFVDPTPYGSISGLPASSTRASAAHVKTIVFASSVASYLAAGDRIQISGAGHYSYNEEAVVSSVSTTTLTYTGTRNYNESATADTGITVKLLSNEAADERYRQLLVWPAISTDRRTLNVDYVREPVALEDDTDEPLMSVSDRIVLLYGALSLSYPSARGNRDEGNNYRALFLDKLARMAGKLDESRDKPRLQPDKTYLGSLRKGRGGKKLQSLPVTGGGGSSSSSVTGTPSRAAQFDANGDLGSSSVTITELAYVSGAGSSIRGISDIATLTNKTINGDNNTISNLAHGAEVDNPSTGVHGVTGSVVGTSDTQTLSNKKLSDSTVTFVDNADNTKQAAFECSGITTATTRTVTVPDADLTMVGTATTQTLTNKTINANSNSLQMVELQVQIFS